MNIIKLIIDKIKKWKKDRAYTRKLNELKKRDPFNYKNF